MSSGNPKPEIRTTELIALGFLRFEIRISNRGTSGDVWSSAARTLVPGLDSSSPAWGKHPIAPARLPNIFSGHWQQKTPPQWKAVISAKQRQIQKAPVNTLKNLFLEKWKGRSDAKSGPGRMMPSSVAAKEFINRGN
jgi:hypothetical protein